MGAIFERARVQRWTLWFDTGTRIRLHGRITILVAMHCVVVLYHPTQSQQDQWKYLATKFPIIFIDNSVNNLGYAAAANKGIKQAIDKGAVWVLLLNQDILMNKTAISQLFVMAQKSAPMVIGPFAGGLDPKRWTTIYPSKQIEYLSGSCLLIHRDVFQKIGGFYEPYFMYYEDVDFCIRARRKGYQLKHVTSTGIAHTDAANTYYLMRNHLLFVLRLAPWRVKLHELLRLPKTLYEYWY